MYLQKLCMYVPCDLTKLTFFIFCFVYIFKDCVDCYDIFIIIIIYIIYVYVMAGL